MDSLSLLKILQQSEKAAQRWSLNPSVDLGGITSMEGGGLQFLDDADACYSTIEILDALYGGLATYL